MLNADRMFCHKTLFCFINVRCTTRRNWVAFLQSTQLSWLIVQAGLMSESMLDKSVWFMLWRRWKLRWGAQFKSTDFTHTYFVSEQCHLMDQFAASTALVKAASVAESLSKFKPRIQNDSLGMINNERHSKAGWMDDLPKLQQRCGMPSTKKPSPISAIWACWSENWKGQLFKS